MRASDSSDDESAASIASTELPEWAGDDLACELCGDAGGAGLLVLCENCEDGCTGARHTYCFQPKVLTEPPEEAWHCDFCLEHGFDKDPFKPAGIGLDEADSPAVSESKPSQRRGSASPASVDGNQATADSAAAEEEALQRAANAAEQAEDAAEEVAAPAGKPGWKQPAAKPGRGAARSAVPADSDAATPSGEPAAAPRPAERQAGDASSGDGGSNATAAAAAAGKPRPILPAKRKAEAEAAPLHDGWAKLPKPSGGALPKLAPVRTGSNSGGSGSGSSFRTAAAKRRLKRAASDESPRLGGVANGSQGAVPGTLRRTDSNESPRRGGAAGTSGSAGAKPAPSGLRPTGSNESPRVGPSAESPRSLALRDDNELFGALTPRSASTAAPSQLGCASQASQQQQQQPVGGSAPLRQPPSLPPPAGGGAAASARMQQRQQTGPPPSQQRLPGGRPQAGRLGDTAAGGARDKPKGAPPRMAASSNTFSNILSEMQSKAKEYNAHEEQLKREAEERNHERVKYLDMQRKSVVAGRGACLWSGAMQLHVAAVAGAPDDGGGATVEVLQLAGFALGNGANSAAASTALPTSFDARIVSMEDIELGYADAHIGAALLFGANTADIGSVMRVGSLCRSLQQHGRAIRAELTASQAWLALVPNPPDGGPQLLWGVFVTAGERPQPQHRSRPSAAQRGVLKKGPAAVKKPLTWTDGSRSEDCCSAVERGPGPTYRDPGRVASSLSDAAAAAGSAEANGQADAARGRQWPPHEGQQGGALAASVAGQNGSGSDGWGRHLVDAQQHGQQQPRQQQQAQGEQPPRQPDGEAAQQSQQHPQPPPAAANGAAPAEPPAPAAPAAAAPPQPAQGKSAVGQPSAAAGALEANGVEAPKPLRGFRFSLVGYSIGPDKTTDVQRALAGARALGAEHFRFPVAPGSVSALLLHPAICQGGFENNQWEFCAKDFLLKPPVQFFRGLDYLTMAAGLGGRPSPTAAAPHELLPCGITVITDAATLASDPDALKKLFNKLKQGAMVCGRARGCSWAVKLSPPEHERLQDAYRRSHQKEVGQALQMFQSRLTARPGGGPGAGPALAGLLSPEEMSSKVMPDPPQLVRDAVKVAYKHMGDCRHVVLASVDRALVATGANQSSILACLGLDQALLLVSQIVDHLDSTAHRPGELH